MTGITAGYPMFHVTVCLLVLAALPLLVACSGGASSLPKENSGLHDTVHVEFINGSDQSVIAVSDMPLTQLPDSFRIETSLEMAGKKWSVMSAEPADKTDFGKTGKLRVVLVEITKMPMGDLFFSLPTISDDFGVPAGDELPHDGLFQIHEDDWRQIEFVALDQVQIVERELADIREIYETQRAEVGFKKVHVRERIPMPLQKLNLSLAEVQRYLPPEKEFKAVSIHRTPGTIPASFAWTVKGNAVIWGVLSGDGMIATLCIVPSPGQTDVLAKDLAKMTEEKRLLLVDWCRATSITGDEQAFRTHLSMDEK